MTGSTARYRAFISYSHAVDGQLAPKLQRALQTFAKPWYALRAVRLFRDKTTLSMTSELWPEIEAALLDSEYFLLLASPEAARSAWVAREVEAWCKHRSARNILIVLTDGTVSWDDAANDFDWAKTDALPRALQGQFTHEPLYEDLRWARTDHLSPRHPQFLDAIASISCRLRGLSKDDVIGAEVRENRRTRRLVQLVIVLLLSLASGATYAALTARRALRVADERRIQARGVAETIIFELDDRLAGVPEAADVRRTLSEKAQGLLIVLGGTGASFDKQATRASLVQRSQRAEVEWRAGNIDGARKELEAALRLARELAAYDPMSETARRDVSVCLSRLAEVLDASNDHDGARRYLEQDLTIVRELLARAPTDFKYRTDLAVSLEKLGTICVRLRDFACAEESLTEDVKIMRELHAQYATNEEAARGLAIALTQYGELHVVRDRWVDARNAFDEAVKLQKTLGYDTTSDALRAKESSISLLKLGDACRQTHDDEQALEHFQQALAIRRRLRDRNPRISAAQRDLAVVLGRVADVHFALDQDALAIPPTKEAVSIFEELLREKDDVETRRELGLNLYDLGGAQMRRNEFVQAAESLNKAVDLLRQVHLQRDGERSRPELFQALRRSGLDQDQLGERAASRVLHGEACTLMRAVSNDDLDDEQLVELSFDLSQIAEAQAPHGPESEAVARQCAKDALARLAHLKQQNDRAWSDKEIQAVLRKMERVAAQAP